MVIAATRGRAIPARARISPGWFIPISITAWVWPGRRRKSVQGTPMWLL